MKTKKTKAFSKNRTLFFLQFTLSCTPIQINGGDADVDHSQTIGGDTAKLLGDISPHLPGFRGFGTPVYGRPLVMLQNRKMHAANGTESNELNRIFANKRNCRKRLGELFITLSSSHFYNKTDFGQYPFK